MTFPALSNGYRDPEPTPSAEKFQGEVTIFVVWDDFDYYGPDPAPEPWLFCELDEAKERVAQLIVEQNRYDGEWRYDEYDKVWERGNYKVAADTVYGRR